MMDEQKAIRALRFGSREDKFGVLTHFESRADILSTELKLTMLTIWPEAISDLDFGLTYQIAATLAASGDDSEGTIKILK